MNILWLGKRFYTNKDALRECFCRMYRLPMHWHENGQHVHLWLVDYHTRELISMPDTGVAVVSAPIFGFATLRQVLRTITIRRPHCIVASGDCYPGLLGWVLARLSEAEFVLDVYDKYDDFAGYRRFGGFDPLTFLLKYADGLMFASRALADATDHEAFAGAIIRILRNPDVAAAAAEEKRRACLSRFDWGVVAGGYADVLASAAGIPRGSPP